MTHASKQPKESHEAARLKGLLEDISIFIGDASREQQRRLLLALDELLPSTESMVASWLKELLKNKDFSACVDEACEDEQRRLLMVLEDLQASDRRRYPRKACSLKVTVDDLYTEKVGNISGGGVFVQTSVPFSVGRQVSLAFPFPSEDDPLRMTGEVVWKSAAGIGIRFQSKDKRLAQMLQSV